MRIVSKILILVVLIIIFFGLFLPSPPSSNLIINSDHTTSINGEKVFPVSMYALCSRFFESDSNCTDSLAINNNKTFHFSNSVQIYGSDANGYSKYLPKFENAGVGTSVLARTLPIPIESGGNSPYIYISQLTADNALNGRGIDEPDYTNLTQRNQIISHYNQSKTYKPNTMIYLNNYDHLIDWLPYLDIYGYDGYANTPRKFASLYTRADVVYGHERWFMQLMENRKWTDSVFNNKAVWTVIAGYAVDGPTEVALRRDEARAITWDSIASGSQGISFYGWLPYSGVPSPGVWSNATIAGWYRGFATEIRSLNYILIMPTKTLFWENDRNESYVNITPNPSKTVYVGWPQQKRFVYMLKQPNASVSYLIAVNKDITPISNVQIKVGGLSGNQTVRTLGNETTGSQKAGRIISAKNGVFNDSFDGYAVHIYQVTSSSIAPTTPTTPAIVSRGNTKTHNAATSFSLNMYELVTFNVTANQTITTWTWLKDGVEAGNTADVFSTSWDSSGTKTIKVIGINANGSTSTTTWTIEINPVTSNKFGVGGAAWDFTGTSSNVYVEGRKIKLGFWGENFDDGSYNWNTDFGKVSVSKGKLSMSTSSRIDNTIGNHTDVAFFASWNESDTNGLKGISIRSDIYRSSKEMAYIASARKDGIGMWIVKWNGTAWVNVNQTGTFTRTNGSTSYCVFKAYGNTFKVYCSHTSYVDALSSSPVSQGTDNQFLYGNSIRLEGNANTTWDNLRVIQLDTSGNIINSGSKTVYYDAGTGNQTSYLIINATTPANTSYTVSYRQKYTGPWVQIGSNYIGNKTLPIPGNRYQETEINVTLLGNGTSFPDIETLEFITEQAIPGKIYSRYDVTESGIVDVMDITLVSHHFNEVFSVPYPKYDVNMDGVVDIEDIKLVFDHIGETAVS